MSYLSYDWYMSWYNWYYQINEPSKVEPIVVDVVAQPAEPIKLEPSYLEPHKQVINIANLETLQESFPPRNKNKKKKKKLKSWRD